MTFFNKREIGKQAELEARLFLQKQGLRVIAQNYTCHYGEIDLIMRDNDEVIFIEVRSRYRIDYGHASETINKAKQRKIIKAATHFLQKKQWLYKVNSRFDIIAFQFFEVKWQLEWIKNAFFADW